MSLTSKFDKFKPESQIVIEQVQDAKNDIERYETPGHVRNICFVETHGKQTFLNYSYLISGEFQPDSNTIILLFTTHSVTICGKNLNDLFEALLEHRIKKVTCLDERYISTRPETETIVTRLNLKISKDL